jgi:predicted metal-dependent hydrolase
MMIEKVEFRRLRRSKNIRLSVRVDGRILLTYPWWISQKKASHFLATQEDWLQQQLIKFKSSKKSLLNAGNRADYLLRKEETRILILERLAHFNLFYQFSYQRVSVRNQSSRWGSCSQRKNLNFNYRLIYLPDSLRDYVIVHELCHLQEMNHSASFWHLVAKTMPDYRELRKKLRSL